jgi:type I restriction-modification system DNA methylase subunit
MDKTTIPLFPASQDEINGILWNACDTFRGTIDASEYKNYLGAARVMILYSDKSRNKSIVIKGFKAIIPK